MTDCRRKSPLALSHRRYLSESQPKEPVIVSNAVHTGLYGRKDKIPFAKPEQFFKANLKSTKCLSETFQTGIFKSERATCVCKRFIFCFFRPVF